MKPDVAKHTPGPWSPNSFAIETDASPCFVVAHVEHDGDPDWPDQGIDESTAEANARLIAAAPDLKDGCEKSINALVTILKSYMLLGYKGPDHDTIIALIDTALAANKAALAKTEGR